MRPTSKTLAGGLVGSLCAVAVLGTAAGAGAGDSAGLGSDMPSWSADGSNVAFVGYRQGRPGDIYSVEAYGGRERRLTATKAHEDTPRWSPDGRRIVFVRKVGLTRQLFVMSADGSGQRQLTHGSEQSVAPSWSPDGREIVFVRGRDDVASDDGLRAGGLAPEGPGSASGPGASDVFVLDLDTAVEQRLTHDRAVDTSPAWSPDGRTIAFSSDRGGLGAQQLFVMRRDGSDQRKLTDHAVSYHNELRPAWSPDGGTIAFVTDNRHPPIGNTEIYLVGADGRNSRRLTTHVGHDDWPSWSPDGQIAFVRGRTAFRPEVFVTGAEGSLGARKLTGIHLFFSRLDVAPAVPRAAGPLTVDLTVTGQIDAFTDVECSATLGAQPLANPLVKTAGRRLSCVWRMPADAKGRMLRGVVRVARGGSAVTRTFAARVS